MNTLVLIANSVAAIMVIWGSMCSLNGMRMTSSMLLRVAHVCLGVGAAAVLLAPHYLGREPSAAEMLMLHGTAVLSFRLSFRRPLKRATHDLKCLLGHPPPRH